MRKDRAMGEQQQRRDADCIFCRIAAGEIPCHRVYEDDEVLAFLDVGPLSAGHALIIPKAHYATLDEMPGELAAACMKIAPRLAGAIRDVTGTSAYNVLQNNGELAHQAVKHVHFHIIPKSADGGLDLTWDAGQLGDEMGRDLRTKIAGRLGRA
ncbi:HIT family protein [Phycisphaerales bacterium AB-hyl4]|uniref:HIT family protein n=1 Tax=Natronomicrosphaera hydrolytica TaxID=3242702 RepID=A0ABV4UB20_9BACT